VRIDARILDLQSPDEKEIMSFKEETKLKKEA